MNTFCLGALASMGLLGSVMGAESLYVSTFYDGSVVRIHSDGSTTPVAENLGFPLGIAADGLGRIYVASESTNRVRRIGVDGAVSTMGIAPFGGGYTAMAFDSVGRLFIANQNVGGIVVVNPGGSSQLYVGGLNSPFGLAFDASGILHVAHLDTRRIRGLVSQILPGGKVKAVISDLDSPAGIAFDAQGALFISENRKGSVLKIEPNGNRIVFASGLSGPQGVAFSGNGRLLVAENGSGKVTGIAMTGERVTRASGLQGPMYLAVTDDAPVSLAIAGQGASAPSATLVLEGAPLSYREIYHSLDLILWRSMGRYQLIGGKLLTLTVPLEVDVERGFFASERR